MLQNINGFVNRYKGNYQGFFGKVNNFSWTLNADNTYDITVNLITLGSVIESINSVVPSSPLTSTEIAKKTKGLREAYGIETDNEGELKEGEKDNKVITNLGSDRISGFIAEKILSFYEDGNINNKDYYTITEDVKLNTKIFGKGSDAVFDSIGGYKAFVGKNVPTNCRYYIRFEELLNVIENNVILKIKPSNPNLPPQPTVTFDKSPESTQINYEPNLIPLDPSICIFKPVFTDELGILKTINVPTFSGLEDFVVEKDNVYYGKLMNVYLNLDYVSTVLNTNKDEKNELNLYDFIQKLLNGINRCMGNIPELSLSIKNDREMYILDENPITGYESAYPPINKEVEFNIIGYTPNSGSSFVTDFNFQTKITPKLMTQISIGAAANGTSVGYKNWNQGLTNRFENKYDYSDPINEIRTPEQKEQKYLNDLYEVFKEKSTGNYGSDTYTWTYRGVTLSYGTDFTEIERIGGNTRGRNMSDQGLKNDVFNGIKRIDKYVNARSQKEQGYNTVDKGINDYSNYLLDGFGGIGTNMIRVTIPDDQVSTKENYALKEKQRIQGYLTMEDVFNLTNKFEKKIVPPTDSLYWFASDNKEFMERGYNSFKRYKSSIDEMQYNCPEQVVSGTTGFIPVTLGLTFEGLGGIKIYNKIKVNQDSLPASYPKSLQFVVDGVNHEISKNLWKTSITTISRPKTAEPSSTKLPPSTGNSTDSTANTTIVKGNPLLKEVLKNAEYNPGTASYELALAIGTKEGWNPNANGGVGSRSYRNNNPGNLDFGTLAQTIDPGAAKEDNPYGTNRFAVFSTAELGAKALVETKIKRWSKGKMPITSGNQSLLANVTGKTYKKGSPPSFREFLYTYAPPNENNTEGYLNTVVNNLNNVFPSANITADSIIESIIEIYG